MAPRWNVDRHVLLAVLTLIFSCFVQVAAFTYLTVTGKIIGQAVHLAGLSPDILVQVKSFKRSMTRSLGVVFLAVVLVTATGAAGWREGSATIWHQLAALVVIAAHMAVFMHQFQVIFRNSRLVERALADYEHFRKVHRPKSEKSV